MNIKKAYKLLDYWKGQLRMSDYNIMLKINLKPKEMSIKGAWGVSTVNSLLKCGVIQILSEKFTDNKILHYDFEQTLVHELLHFKFDVIQDHSNKEIYTLLHQNIEDLSRALVWSKRCENVKEIENYNK